MEERIIEFLVQLMNGTKGKIYIKAYVDKNIKNGTEIVEITSVKLNAVEAEKNIQCNNLYDFSQYFDDIDGMIQKG